MCIRHFVTNINGSVEDSELEPLFKVFVWLYTTRKVAYGNNQGATIWKTVAIDIFCNSFHKCCLKFPLIATLPCKRCHRKIQQHYQIVAVACFGLDHCQNENNWKPRPTIQSPNPPFLPSCVGFSFFFHTAQDIVCIKNMLFYNTLMLNLFS